MDHDHDHGDERDHGGAATDAHAGHSVAMFRDRFWLSFALTIPIVLYSEMVQKWFGYTMPPFPGSGAVGPVLGTIVFLYGGTPFLAGAVREVRRRQPGMMLLISTAVVVAFLASSVTSLGWFDLDFWWELAALLTIMLLGHWMEMRAIGQAHGALTALAELLPDEAERKTDAGSELVTIAELEVGNTVLVRPGGRIPADGTVVQGSAAVDESMITGESRPVRRGSGDPVVAGSVATDSAIEVEVSAVGDDTALAGIRRLVEQAQTSRSRAQVLADRAAAALFYIAIGSAAITTLGWLVFGSATQAVVRAVAVLVIACPHALGLAVPLVISISTSMAARHGILVKDRLALERMRSVDVVLFDKTGTLTRGEHRVVGVVATGDGGSDEVLRLAAAVEASSEHPLARAIVAAVDRGIDIPEARDFTALPGRGVDATVEGRVVSVGGPALLRERNLSIPDGIGDDTRQWRDRGSSVVYVVDRGTVIGAIALEDAIRDEARSAVSSLRALGIDVALITGDAEQVARAVAEDLGISRVLFEVLPEDKHREVLALQDAGHRVAMVGDGVNDAPALAQADVGIAIGAGTDVAIESAGIVLASDDPRAVVAVRRLSRAGYVKMIQNLVWATGYNVVAIPLAAGAFAWAGFTLAPAIGAILMSLSTIIVAMNAQLLRRVDLGASQ
ncbi:MAG TPA: heavy metal translocating P-type ATPase [Acidimicrobiia bacterium]|nr:heavy metal translocating P-type ATPase [Acidimicrobiia bacterium]